MSRAHTSLPAAPCVGHCLVLVQLLVGVTRTLVAIGVQTHRQVRRIPEAWEDDVVVTRRGVLQYLMGSLGDGSVVMWGTILAYDECL